MWVPDTHKLEEGSLEEKSRIGRSIPGWWSRRTLCVEPKYYGPTEKIELVKGNKSCLEHVSSLHGTVFHGEN